MHPDNSRRVLRLRGHHLLCLLGYRGMGYSAEFCTNMTSIYETLRQEPGTWVELVGGPDDLCAYYPKDQHSHCEGTVHERDEDVLARLGLRIGTRHRWKNIVRSVARHIEQEAISSICSTCPWEPYGVCREGVRLVRAGEPLPPVARST
ncbi:DUF1284 domain-containing protein [Paenibacillus sp. YYML68]|uniref:DUF1284 domain-containing protein n=1 Tax=Paenibacillus sp. YYML68 TaxID=2909250 RepID=UPI0024902A44|nr:DUF1284 domain-containing protein [Paenibacillus sp. YYML68]